MTVTAYDVQLWLGTKLSAAISSDQLDQALADADDYCQGKMNELGIGTGGHAYDAAIKYVAKASIYRQLDAMGIKPQSLDMGGTLHIASDVTQAIQQFMTLADERLMSTAIYNSGTKSDLFIRRLRGGQGIR